MLFFDAHVHLHHDVKIDELLDSASSNFARYVPADSLDRPSSLFLLLAEIANRNVFLDLKNEAAANRTYGAWQMRLTQEAESLLLFREDQPDRQFFLVAGRQIVTSEKIEVLALATPATIADGLGLERTVEEALGQGGLAVLPWGVGKWLGKRGEILRQFLAEAAADRLFVGDNGGRPSFWPAPRLFQLAGERGIRLLPGSDPLPLAKEHLRIGSYGGYVAEDFSAAQPAAALRRLLIDPAKRIVPFGKQMDAWTFLQAQVGLRRLKGIR